MRTPVSVLLVRLGLPDLEHGPLGRFTGLVKLPNEGEDRTMASAGPHRRGVSSCRRRERQRTTHQSSTNCNQLNCQKDVGKRRLVALRYLKNAIMAV